MQNPSEDLEAAILNLPAEERARLLELLLASFEPRSLAQEAWLNLAKQRREDIHSGKVSMVPGEQALARVRARLI